MEIQVGPEAKASLKMVDGKLVMAIEYVGAQTQAALSVSHDVEQFGQMLKDIVPGEGGIPDAIIDGLIGALKGI